MKVGYVCVSTDEQNTARQVVLCQDLVQIKMSDSVC